MAQQFLTNMMIHQLSKDSLIDILITYYKTNYTHSKLVEMVLNITEPTKEKIKVENSFTKMLKEVDEELKELNKVKEVKEVKTIYTMEDIEEPEETEDEDEETEEEEKSKKVQECLANIHYDIEPENRRSKDELKTTNIIIVRILKGFEEEFRKLMKINPLQKIKSLHDKDDKDMKKGFDWQSSYPEYVKADNDRYDNACLKFFLYTEELRNKFITTFKSNNVYKKNINKTTKSLWYPHEPVNEIKKNGYYTTKEKIQPQYPIYIPSYKRYDTLYTVLSLEELNIKDYYIIIRPTENEPEKYKEALKKHNISLDKLLIMPLEFIEQQTKAGNGYSVIPRNYGWNHAIKNSFTHHWSLDDNIKGFFYRNKGQILPFKNTGYSFKFIEEYIKKYPNTFQAGMYPTYIGSAKGDRTIIIKNSRIYSCMLNRHYKNFRYEGIHNEDTDLSLRFLKDGKATLDFQIFLCGKQCTLSVPGGNRDSAYLGKGFEEKADEIVRKYPDIAKKVIKYGRIHHQINYKGFYKNDLTLGDYKMNNVAIDFIETKK
tara:strand:- start:2223 stop:3851 length:1629 start_codon:yes stop_codon:yes gene_type:complete